jgi:LysM repeat protein
MEIISYQITGARATAAVAGGTARTVQRGALRTARQQQLSLAAFRAAVFTRLGLSVGVLGQYRRFFCLVALGALLGGGLYTWDLHRETFARTVDLVPYTRLDRGDLDEAFEQFAMESDAGSAYRDELALFTDDADAARRFVFTNPVSYTTYTVQRGDTVSGLSVRFGLKNISTLIAANSIGNVRELYSGQKLKNPSMDGLNYTVEKSDTLAGLSSRYNIAVEDLLDVNDLATETLQPGQVIFVPGAELDSTTLRKAMGELFALPLRGKYRLTSGFGYRRDPFTGVRQHHNGLDMAAPLGTPIRSAMIGRVVTKGWSNIYGNYIIINHGNGYQTLYGHLSKIQVRKDQVVNQGSQIGLVGSTGYSTGAHLHFTVYRNGKLINPVTVLRF